MDEERPTIHASGDGSKMTLEADAYHEGDEGVYVDCPSCGSPAYLEDVALQGRCTGYLDQDVEAENAAAVGGFCSAELSLELVWTEDE